MIVSLFKKIKETENAATANIEKILHAIQSGKWQDVVLPIMKEPDKDKRTAMKRNIPYFTASGTFDKRSNNGLKKHSGLIAIDIDEAEDVEQIRKLVQADDHTFACFKSVSGRGLCVLVRIKSDKHYLSFKGLEKYYFENYKVCIDTSCKDVSRPRFVSFDPDLYHNPQAKIFTKIAKPEPKRKPNTKKYLHTTTKFDRVMSLIDRDIAPSYDEWCNLGFALAHEFGGSGRDYFHHISSFHSDYDQKATDKQYDKCLKSADGRRGIGTFYYMAAAAGIEVSNEKEREIERVAYFQKKGKRGAKSAEEVLKVKGIDVDDSVKATIKAVYDAPEEFNPVANDRGKEELNIDDVIDFIKTAFNIRKNEQSHYYEDADTRRELEEEDFNSYYIECKKVFDKLTREMFNTIVFSNETPKYNPIRNYFENLTWDGVERIVPLSKTITSNTGTPEYRLIMLSRWLAGIVESIYSHDRANELMLILAGKKKTGKSEFFKRLLPAELRRYLTISALDSRNPSDDHLLLCSSLLIFNEEFTGNTVTDYKKMKSILSTPMWSIRSPYGKKHVRRKRCASLCATSNDLQVLNDPTGNRRIIVFEVTGKFDYIGYNSIDKEQLFAEVVARYKEGWTSQLEDYEDAMMEKYTNEDYSETVIERELIQHYLEPGKDHMTTTMIKVELEKRTYQKLSVRQLGQQMIALGFERAKHKGAYGYLCKWKNDHSPPEPWEMED